MNRIIAVLAIAALTAGCGIEAVGTAATVAAAKQKELEAPKKTMEQAQQKIQQSTEQIQKNAEKAGEADK